MPEHVPKELEEMPPTAKLVYKILEYEGKFTQQELRKETFLAQRTVYNALQDLEEINAIDSHPNSKDLRQTIYYLKWVTTTDGRLLFPDIHLMIDDIEVGDLWGWFISAWNRIYSGII